MILRILKVIIILFIPEITLAKTKFFQDGLNLFNDNKFEEAKFKFEQDIVVNPKSEMSYLYLSKIFKNLKKKLEEQNLLTVILLNPQNEEAILYLARLKLEASDYKKSKELNNRLKIICKIYCEQSNKLKIEIENLSKNKCNFKN